MMTEAQNIAAAKGAMIPGLVEDYRFSYYDPTFLSRMTDIQDRARSLENLSRLEITDFQSAYTQPFSKQIEIYEENFDFVLRDEQWTEADKKSIIARGRKPYTLNVLKPYARRMLAEQIGQRWHWRAVPLDEQAQDFSEYANHILQWVYQTSDFHRIASLVYRDGVIGGIGVSGTQLDPFNPTGAIKLERYRPQEFMWDMYSAKDGSLEGCEYIWRGYHQSKKALAALYPQWDFTEVSSGALSNTGDFAHTLMRPRIQAATGKMEVGMKLDGYLRELGNRMVYCREFYRRRHTAVWTVRDGYNQTEQDFPNVQDAYAYGQDLTQKYLQIYAAQVGSIDDFVPKVSLPMSNTKTLVDKFFWCGDMLIDVQEDRENRIPYQFFIPEYTDGTITSFFQSSKDAQRLRNVAAGTLHQQMAGTKPTRIINKAKLSTKLTDQQINEKNVRSGETWIFNDPTAKDLSAFMYDVPPPSHGPLSQVIYSVMSENIDVANGGLSSIGVQESAGESGRAIQMRRSAASMASAPALDVLRDWQTRVGEDALYLAQFMDPSITMTVIDDMQVPSHKALIDDGIQSIKGMKFMVQLKEVIASPSERDARMDRAMTVVQNAPTVIEDMMPIIVKYADFDPSDRKMYEENRDARLKSQGEAYQAEMALRRDELDAKAIDRQIQNEIRMREVQVLEANRPKTSISIKAPATPGIIGEALTNSFGEEVHPLAIAGDMALGAQMELEKLDKQQKQEVANTPEWARHGGHHATGTMTAKNSAARGNKHVEKD